MEALKPVVVDLDGSLIRSDTLLESFMVLLKQNPFYLFLVPFWLFKGKANLKNQIANRVELNVETLPYNQAVIDLVKTYHEKGHRCYLATGTVRKFAFPIANHLGFFEDVFATDDETNLTGSNKADYLVERFGEKGFIYLGNHAVDLKIWQHADQAIVVNHGQGLAKQAAKVTEVSETIELGKAGLKTWIKAIRVHQWVKNALILVPLLTSHQLDNPDLILLCFLGFLSYSLAASSVYVLNDLVDLEADRLHPSKCKRPFAAGIISLHSGILAFPVLLLSAFLLALLLPVNFQLALLVYYILTVLYSFKLKRIIMLDTITLASLYTMRIIAGTLLIAVPFSFWLLSFSMFIFLSLALVKRYTELLMMKSEGVETAIGRGYHADDASMVASLGAASGYIAVMVFALYINSPEVAELYSKPGVLWLASIILLYWISRVWIIAHRGQMNDDPIVFAVKDIQSIITGILVFAVFLMAT